MAAIEQLPLRSWSPRYEGSPLNEFAVRKERRSKGVSW